MAIHQGLFKYLFITIRQMYTYIHCIGFKLLSGHLYHKIMRVCDYMQVYTAMYVQYCLFSFSQLKLSFLFNGVTCTYTFFGIMFQK